MNLNTIKQTCEKHGEYEARQINIGGRSTILSQCPKCAAEDLKQRRIKEQEDQENSKQLRTQNCIAAFEKSIPMRFRHATLDNFITDTPQKAEKKQYIDRYANAFGNKIQETGGGLIMTGNPGTGKTHLAIGLGRDLSNLGWFVAYQNLTELIRSIRATWKDDTKSEDEIIRRLKAVDLLIIDEVGAQAGSDNERNIVFEIINGRYENVKPTIIISNYSINEVAEFISERSVDRITQGGAVLNFTWESQRGVA